MAHHIYQTQGFVLRGANTGEADRTIFVFTESLGLLCVNARAARKVSSKLRYSLQNYSLIRVALVRGKNVWRLTDAEETVSFSPSRDSSKLKLIAGMFSLVNRFVHGEGENAMLFESLHNLFIFLQREELSDEEILLTETIAACRILAALGYVGESKTLSPFLGSQTSRYLLENFAPHRHEALQEINRALRESQL
jgi:DNA repair protein RecO (recombination protein O)